MSKIRQTNTAGDTHRECSRSDSSYYPRIARDSWTVAWLNQSVVNREVKGTTIRRLGGNWNRLAMVNTGGWTGKGGKPGSKHSGSYW